MTALHTTKRNKTAKEMAQRLSISERTVRRLIALPREDYEKTARIRRKKAYILRELGFKWKEIGEKLDTTKDGAIALYKRFIAIDLQNEDQELAKIIEERKNEKSHPVDLDDYITDKIGFMKHENKTLNTDLDKKLDKKIEDLFNGDE
ncbi:HTH domain-containing protein [Klebsiella michiganensis]|uniref:HTH domain-containing protein n=1 Tax=Klebsiella michiganensis TaxID=1134687 RepID=UPI002FF52B79